MSCLVLPYFYLSSENLCCFFVLRKVCLAWLFVGTGLGHAVKSL